MAERSTNPGTAAVLSFIFNGLGQIYNGQIKKGLFLISLSALSMLIFIIGAVFIILWLIGKVTTTPYIIYGFFLSGLGLIFICILGIWSIFDAYNVAKKS